MLKAIETEYKDYRFRSRLEARWAVFFDTLGVKWEYEKEGYDLGEAGWYLPDFWFPELDCFVEVKGKEPTEDEKAKCLELARQSGKLVYMLFNVEPFWTERIGKARPGKYIHHGNNMFFSPGGRVDWLSTWGVCPICDRAQIGNLGSHQTTFNEKYDPPAPIACIAEWHDCLESPRLAQAYRAAKSARFEHGERGTR